MSFYSDLNINFRPNLFARVFVPVVPKNENTRPGLLQALQYNQETGEENYIVQNASIFSFVIYHIKKVRSWVIKDKRTSILKYFSWEPDKDKNYPEQAKISFILAGALYDKELQTDKKIYFKCAASRVGNIINLLSEVKKFIPKLEQPFLGDERDKDYNYLIRRPIYTVKPVKETTAYDSIYFSFAFAPWRSLKKEEFLLAIKEAENTMDAFRAQFDLSDLVNNVINETDNGSNHVNMFDEKLGDLSDDDLLYSDKILTN